MHALVYQGLGLAWEEVQKPGLNAGTDETVWVDAVTGAPRVVLQMT